MKDYLRDEQRKEGEGLGEVVEEEEGKEKKKDLVQKEW